MPSDMKLVKKSQKEIVADHLREHGEISNFYCMDNRITIRLGAIIFTLQKEGWVFDDEKSGFIPGTKNWCYVVKSAPQA